MPECHKQFGWTRDPRIVPLEPGHVLVEYDDDKGPYWEIHEKEEAEQIEAARKSLWKRIIDLWTNSQNSSKN